MRNAFKRTRLQRVALVAMNLSEIKVDMAESEHDHGTTVQRGALIRFVLPVTDHHRPLRQSRCH